MTNPGFSGSRVGRAGLATVAALVLFWPQTGQAQAPAPLAIASPAPNTTIQPGEALTIVLTSPAGLTFSKVALPSFSEGGSLTIGDSVPFSATVIIPADTPAGIYQLGGSGITSTGQSHDVVPVTLFIERGDRPVALGTDDSPLPLSYPGQQTSMRFHATFADGNTLDVTKSSRIAYATSNDRIVTIDDHATVTAVGTGTATLLATYTPPVGGPVVVTIPVTVDLPDFSPTPAVVDFGPLSVGASTSRSVVFTNTRRGAVMVRSLSALGAFSVQSDCVTASPIAPGSSCTATVTFAPHVGGLVRGFLRMSNSFSGVQGLALFGEGLGLRASTTILGSSANPSVLGQPLTFTATVADAGGGGSPAPAGTVTFAEGATTLGSVPLSSGGTASTAVTGLGVGSHAITAGYSGDTAFGPSTSTALTQVVRYAAAGTTCQGAAGHQILQPVNADGTSVFKQGRTVPAKFRVCNASGQSIGTAGVVQDFRLTQVISGTTSDVNENVPSTTPDAAFRWDASEQQWIFNIATAGQEAQKTYVYTITLNDGTTIGFRYGLR